MSAICLWIAQGREAAAVSRQDLLKAAYVYNITKFVDWPAGLGSSLVLCVSGGNALAAMRDSVAGKSVRGRQIDVVPLEGAEPGRCHVAYLTDPPGSSGALASMPHALTVCDAEVRRSSCIVRLFEQGNRLRFDVDLALARRADLTISSRLLTLAADVRH